MSWILLYIDTRTTSPFSDQATINYWFSRKLKKKSINYWLSNAPTFYPYYIIFIYLVGKNTGYAYTVYRDKDRDRERYNLKPN